MGLGILLKGQRVVEVTLEGADGGGEVQREIGGGTQRCRWWLWRMVGGWLHSKVRIVVIRGRGIVVVGDGGIGGGGDRDGGGGGGGGDACM